MDASVSTKMSNRPENTVNNAIARYGKQIFGFIRGKVSSNEDAKDILQDVWYQLSRITNLDEIESISGWLYRVARNRVIDSYRKKKPDRIEDFNPGEDDYFSFKEILLMDHSENPELGLFKEMFWNELLEALDELPEKQREVFVLNEIEDMTLQEIADKFDTNIKTIISRKGYAVKHLRTRLNHLYQELNN